MRNLLSRLLNRRPFRAEPASFEEVERQERVYYQNFLRDGNIVFDVGANTGQLTRLFSAKVGSGAIHAFEPSSVAFEELAALCRDREMANVVVNQMALSDCERPVTLQIYDGDLAALNSEAKRPLKDYGLDVEPIGEETIAAITIDKYCEEHGIRRIDLMKIDVEGAELQVMRGAERMLSSQSVGCLAFEFGQTTFDMGNRPGEIIDFLTAKKYRISNLVKGDPIFPGGDSVENARFSMHIAIPE